ncbi:MAG: pilus assembly protein [Alphaproteobacteria bacterium]|nr:pilus assembly protein [Alphaproteobacteria bacterium]
MMRFINRFRRSDRGLAAIEFALIIPVMLFTFFGIAEIANYILAARKVANVASSAADLTAQDTVIDDAEMADIMGALDVVLRPFDPQEAQIRISSVVADDNGETTVAWSDARNTGAYAEGTPIDVPDDIVPNNQGIIMTEVSFTYRTLFGMYLNDGMTVSDTFYLKPRRSTTVQRQ